jgi:hypothetical protein
MTHLDGDTLALVALAELELSPAERLHLAECPACAGELDALRHTVLIGRSAGSVNLIEPADAVWGRVHATLGLSGAVAAAPRLADRAPAEPADAGARDTAETADARARGTDPSSHARAAAIQNPTADPSADLSATPPTNPPTNPPPHSPSNPQPHSDSAPAPLVDLSTRRRRTWLPVAAAACAVGIVGGIVGGAWWQSTRGPASEPVIAQAQLEALPGWTASGSASVEEAADGRRDVVVDLAADVSADDSADGLREVWLLRADASGLVSLGLLDGATGRFSIPAGIDLAEFPVVDVSAEPADGNPAHSGDSIVRGTLSEL